MIYIGNKKVFVVLKTFLRIDHMTMRPVGPGSFHGRGYHLYQFEFLHQSRGVGVGVGVGVDLGRDVGVGKVVVPGRNRIQ